jgi:hypothetical protein
MSHVKLFFKVWSLGGTKPLFISFLHYLLYIHTNSFITFAPISLSLQAQVEGLHWGVEPRFELGAALRQPYTLSTESCRTLHVKLTSDIFVQEGVKVVIEPDWGSCTPGFYQCSGSKRVCIPVR